MTRHRKTDAHIATIRVSIPIAAMDAASVQAAADAIAEIQSELPPGSIVEVLNSRFGRVDAPAASPQAEPVVVDAMAAIKADILQRSVPPPLPIDPELPASLKRSA